MIEMLKRYAGLLYLLRYGWFRDYADFAGLA